MIILHGLKEVSKLNSHIGIVVRVETSIEPSSVVDLDLGEMKPTILLSLIVAKCFDRTQ